MKYERLTERKNNSTGIYVTNWKGEKVWKDAYDLAEKHHGSIDDVFDRLAELEDKIEQGLLIELPCKVGADVWVIILQRDNFTDEPYKKVARATFRLSMLNDIGKTVFLTREDAEKRLKELQE